MFGWVQVFGKVLDSMLNVSRVIWNSVEVDMWYRLLRIDAGEVEPTCPSFATLTNCKYCLVGLGCMGRYWIQC